MGRAHPCHSQFSLLSSVPPLLSRTFSAFRPLLVWLLRKSIEIFMTAASIFHYPPKPSDRAQVQSKEVRLPDSPPISLDDQDVQIQESVKKAHILSWNARGINEGDECGVIKSLICSRLADLVYFQETKVQQMLTSLGRSLGVGVYTPVPIEERENFWNELSDIRASDNSKYGQEGHGWRAKRAYGAIGVGVWKEIWKETDWCWDNMGFIVGKGSKINFWTDVWCKGTRLSQNFPHLYAWLLIGMRLWRRCGIRILVKGGWNLRFLRDFNDWEMDMIGNLLHVLRDYKPSMEEDSVCWKGGRNDKYRVKEAYRLVARPNDIGFPSRCIWVDSVPTKVAFYAWEATWGRVLTLDRLQKRGWQLPNCCFLCGREEETVNHILIHCIIVRVLWDIVIGLSGVQWVFPETVKEVLTSWRGPFVGKKRKKIWKSIPLCIF
ncbi:hypothetical protein CK203_076449 [Vitis vinifera]|uniref:Reverse transcriptase zinc-binding domain-containing protein n=1 Tax=Vitis vinifera TaxID=29760 RepID=A0A438C0J6_VITVI|nr:hypothetical protein CK203_076449 [Vitis vinifera]